MLKTNWMLCWKKLIQMAQILCCWEGVKFACKQNALGHILWAEIHLDLYASLVWLFVFSVFGFVAEKQFSDPFEFFPYIKLQCSLGLYKNKHLHMFCESQLWIHPCDPGRYWQLAGVRDRLLSFTYMRRCLRMFSIIDKTNWSLTCSRPATSSKS